MMCDLKVLQKINLRHDNLPQSLAQDTSPLKPHGRYPKFHPVDLWHLPTFVFSLQNVQRSNSKNSSTDQQRTPIIRGGSQGLEGVFGTSARSQALRAQYVGGDGRRGKGGAREAAGRENAGEALLLVPQVQLVEGQLPPVVHVVLRPPQ